MSVKYGCSCGPVGATEDALRVGPFGVVAGATTGSLYAYDPQLNAGEKRTVKFALDGWETGEHPDGPVGATVEYEVDIIRTQSGTLRFLDSVDPAVPTVTRGEAWETVCRINGAEYVNFLIDPSNTTVPNDTNWTITIWPRQKIVLQHDLGLSPGVWGDTEMPVMIAFDVPTTSSSLTIVFDVPPEATDNLWVTGYAVTVDTTTVPDLGDFGAAPTEVTVGSEGAHTLRAYARDAAGNISEPMQGTCTVALMGVVAWAAKTLEYGTGGSVALTDPIDTPTTAPFCAVFSGNNQFSGGDPTDNKGNTYIEHDPANRPRFPSYADSGIQFWRCAPTAGGAGHTWSKDTYAGGEANVNALVCAGVNAVESFPTGTSANIGTSGTLSTASVTTAGPALLLAFFSPEWGFDTVSATDWTAHTAIQSTSISSYTFSRVVEAGTYSCTVDFTGPQNQGACMFIVALRYV